MILPTLRLVLRPWKSTDLSSLLAMNSEPEVHERSAWGQGYAHEAVAAVLDSVREHTAFSETVAIISKPNERSARTAQRLGFRHDEAADFLYPDSGLAAELRPHRVFRLS